MGRSTCEASCCQIASHFCIRSFELRRLQKGGAGCEPGRRRRAASCSDDALRVHKQMNVISRLGLTTQGHPIRPPSSATERTAETTLLPHEPADSPTLGMLVVHGAEFVADFIRYSGRRAVVAGSLVAL